MLHLVTIIHKGFFYLKNKTHHGSHTKKGTTKPLFKKAGACAITFKEEVKNIHKYRNEMRSTSLLH